MKKSVLLGLGTVALAGLLGKRYLDGQKANPNNLYDDYKEAIVGESGKFVLKGLKGVAEGLSLGYEKLFGEAKFNDEFDEESFEKMVRARQELCGHLNGQALAPELAKSERFAWAKLSREEFFGICEPLEQESALDKARDKANKLTKSLDGIYELESECFKTQGKIEALCAKMAKFKGFEPPRLTYSVVCNKYEFPLSKLGKKVWCLTPFMPLLATQEPIPAAKAHLSKAQKSFDEGVAWLDELDECEFSALSKDEQAKIHALAKEARQINAFIKAKFVHYLGFWLDTQVMIECENKLLEQNADENGEIRL